MASESTVTPNAGNLLYQRILSLDRSKEDFPSQIAEAYNILEIDPEKISFFYNEGDGAVQGKYGVGPKEEWCMRWLLKRFNVEKIQANSLTLNTRAWLLLRLLVARLPTHIAAGALNMHKFLEALEKTLQWLDEEAVAITVPGDRLTQQIHESTDESSSATLEAPEAAVDDTKSKKRKREMTKFMPTKAHKPMPFDAAVLYVSISSTLQQIKARTLETKERDQGFASEYMKTVIKCTPDQAAKILGHSLSIIGNLFRNNQYENLMNNPNITKSLVPPIIALWDLRSTVSDDLPGHSSMRAFSTVTLVPALQVLTALRRRPGNIDEDVIRDLERLIIVHTIRPLRSKILRRKKAEDHDAIATDTFDVQFLASLSDAVSSELDSIDSNEGACSSLESIALFFDLGLKSVPLKTTKQRITEAPWLQDFFLQLARCTYLLLPMSLITIPPEASMDTLKKMLSLMNVSKVQMETSVLEIITKKYAFNSDESSDDTVDWLLVSLCMQNDENLMLPFSSENKKLGKKSRATSRLLKRLLSQLTATGLKSEIRTSKLPLEGDVYNFTLEFIVSPLEEAFVHARNLPGFIEVWQQEIATWRKLSLSLNRPTTNTERLKTIWEDDKLSRMVTAHIESNLTVGQICEILQNLFDIFQPWLASTELQSPEVYACTTILDCLVDGIKGENIITQTSELIRKLYEGLSEMLNNERPLLLQCRWRIWRTLAAIMTRWSIMDQFFGDEAMQGNIVATAQKVIQQALSSEDTSQDSFEEAIHAMQFMVAFTSTQDDNKEERSSQNGALQAVTKTIVDLMETAAEISRNSISSVDHNGSLGVSWDGSGQGVENHNLLLLACAAELILSPLSLKTLDNDLLYQFLTQLYWLACMDAAPKAHHSRGVTYSWLWEEVQHERIINEYDLLTRTLCKVSVQQVDENSSLTFSPVLIKHHLRFAVESILRIPNAIFERQERSQVANTIASRLLDEKLLMEITTMLGLLNLLIQCMDSPNKSMTMTTDTKFLWTLARKLDEIVGSSLEQDVAFLHAYKQLTRAILTFAITRTVQGWDNTFLQNFCDFLLIVTPNQTTNLTCATSLLFTTSLNTFWKHRDELSKILEEKLPALANLRMKYFEALSTEFTETAIGQPLLTIGVMLESLASLSDLLRLLPSEAEFWVALQSCITNVAKITAKEHSLPARDSKSILIAENILVLASKVDMMRQASLVSAEVILKAVKLTDVQTHHAQRNLLNELKILFNQSNPVIQADILSEIIRSDDESTNDRSSLLQLRSILSARDGLNENVEVLRSTLAQSLSTLCDRLSRSTTDVSCTLRMHCIDIMIRKKPWCVLQWHVDNILAAITIMTSISSPKLPAESAGRIFTCLCRHLSSLLTAHRAKLGGRYHLILLALQGLLRCLFEPFSPNAGPKESIAQPPWLKPQSHTLNESHASAYARILTTICDPSVSAVIRTKNRSRQELNDETKKVRSIAGQHLQYLAMEFCQCQLRGRMSSEMRTALNPGLYALFDAMSQDVMRTVNSALDVSGRAIFKVVYDDYRMFGRWKGA